MSGVSKQLAWGSGAAFLVLCVLAYATWMLQAQLNTLRAFEVPAELVETQSAQGAVFHLKRDPTMKRTENEMAQLSDDIFIMQCATMGMGLASLIVPFFIMGKIARRAPKIEKKRSQ